MKRILNRFLLALICGTLAAVLLLMPVQMCLPAYAAEPESECWAVIVGVSEYKSYDEQPYCADDAQELASRLISVWGDDHVKLITNSAATKQAIKNAITDWLASNAGTNDVVLFYFSGMAERDKASFAPYNAYYKGTWIYASELDDWLSVLNSEKMVVILEISHAGRFEKELSDSGRVVLMACRSDESHWYNTGFQHSIFTYYILEALREFEAADSDSNFELSAEEIFYYAEDETTWKVSDSGDQHPQMSDQYSGQLSLLVQFIFSAEPDLPSGSEVLILDNEEHLSTPVELTWAPGSVHALTLISPVSGKSGTRYVFLSWDDGNTSTSKTISGGGAYTANYQRQYELAIESAFGETEGEGWYDEGLTATISTTSIEGPTIRYIFTGWSGDYSGTEAMASVTMDSSKTVTANWRTDYLLTIESDYGQPEGEGWYESGSTATISAPSSTGVGIRHIFTGWSGDYSGTETMATVTMDSSKTVTANWRTDYMQLYIFIGVVVVGGGGALTVLMMRRRKKAVVPARVEKITPPPVTPPPAAEPPVAEPPTAKYCANCGAEIKPGDAFCTKCGKAVKE